MTVVLIAAGYAAGIYLAWQIARLGDDQEDL
jgi:hypothetical protein